MNLLLKCPKKNSVDIFMFPMMAMFFQFSIIRTLSFTHWFHIIYATITIAMLGYAIGGFLYHQFNFFKKINYLILVSLGYFLFAIFSLITVIYGLTVSSNIVKIINDISVGEIFTIIKYYFPLLIFLIFPFILASLVTLRILDNHEKKHLAYAIDLIGTAFGAILFFIFFSYFEGNKSILFISLISILLCLISYTSFRFQKISNIFFLTSIGLIFYVFFLIFSYNFINKYLEVDTQKNIFWSFNDKRIFKTDNSPLFRVDASYFDKSKPALGALITIDGDAQTQVHPANLNDLKKSEELFIPVQNGHSRHLAVQLTENKNTSVIIGSGGGLEVQAAYQAGFKSIYAVDIDPIRQKWLSEDPYFLNITDSLYLQKEVIPIISDGRGFIRFGKKKYDSIILQNVDSLTGMTVGAYNLLENYLYTEEALVDYINHLNEGGILQLTRPKWGQKEEAQKIFTTAIKAAKKLNLNLNQIIFLENGGYTLLIKKGNFTPNDVKKIKYIMSDDKDFKFLFLESDKLNSHINTIYGNIFKEIIASLKNKKLDNYLSKTKLNISPARDDKPFYYELSKFDNLADVFVIVKSDNHLKGLTSWSRYFLNFSIYSIIFLILSCAVISFLSNKFFRQNTKPSFNKYSTLSIVTYFSSIGMGYMLFQFGLSQKFTLLTGSPLKSLLVIIPSMVIGTSAGSAFKNKIDLGKKFKNKLLKFNFIPLISLISLMVIFLIIQNIVSNLIINNQSIRIFIVIIFSFLSGFVVGPNLPHGLEIFCKTSSPRAIALAWTVNGFASVFGGIISILFSIVYGFSATISIAIFFYFIALLTSSSFILYNRNN